MITGSAIYDALDVFMKGGENVFVYGTLRKGEYADLSASASKFSVDFLGKDTINGQLFHLGAFPGLKLVSNDNSEFNPSLPKVVGEVFYMKDASVGTLLDAYEGYPHHYGREQVVTEGGRLVWVYVYAPLVMSAQLIETGDWKNPRIASSRSIPVITTGRKTK